MDKNDPRRAPSDEELDTLNEHWEDPGDPDGVVAADEAEKWRQEHPPRQPVARPKKYHPFRKFLIIIIVIVAAAYGAFWFGNKQANKDNPPAKPAQTTKKAPVVQTNVTKQYSSTNFTLSFNYLDGWKVTDTPAKLSVVSPAMQLTTTQGKKQVHLLLTIQNQQTTIAGFPASGATEVIESQKLTYKQPTTIQKAQTYVSYLGYTTPTGLDAIYVTGDYGYVQSQVVPMSDVVKGNPLVNVSFATCVSSDCATDAVTPVTLQASGWSASVANKDITNLIESIELN